MCPGANTAKVVHHTGIILNGSLPRRMQVREGQRFDSTMIKNNNNPSWGQDGKGEEFGFLVHEPRHQSLSITLYDADALGGDDTIGW